MCAAEDVGWPAERVPGRPSTVPVLLRCVLVGQAALSTVTWTCGVLIGIWMLSECLCVCEGVSELTARNNGCIDTSATDPDSPARPGGWLITLSLLFEGRV